MSINQKSGRQTFRRRFVSGSLFVSRCPPECYLQSETKIEPDLKLYEVLRVKIKVERDAALTFRLDVSYIASILFTHLIITRQLKSTTFSL